MELEVSSSAPAPASAPVKQLSVLEAFLRVRELRPGKPVSPPSSPSKRPLWHSYSVRRHGDRVALLQRALRVPEPDYSESRDAYVRRKRPQRFLDLHADAETARAEFDARTRATRFQRAVVDRPVCDRQENRCALEAALRRLALEQQQLDVADVDATNAP